MWLQTLSVTNRHDNTSCGSAASLFKAANTSAHRSSIIGKTPTFSLRRASILGARWSHLLHGGLPNIPPRWMYTKPIQKSQQDDREYRLIRLDNGLQAMLVHDPTADKAAASLDVAVGHLHDPASTRFVACCHTHAKCVSLTSVILIGRHARARAFLRASFVHGARHSLTLECYSIPTYPNREPNNFRRRTNTPGYVATCILRRPSDDSAVSLQKQRFFQRVHFVHKYELLFQRRNARASRRSQTLLWFSPLSVVFTI
jgi:hypothetical protein